MSTPRYQQPITSPLNHFATAELVATDFDGTVADTFEEAPGIYGVDEAYRLAIEETFDFDKDALTRYIEDGEHNNRPPTEIVYSLAPNASSDGLLRLTETLVIAKLKILHGQIGKPLPDGELWPRPLPGFIDTWTGISEAKQKGRNINTACISSGHAKFIRKCLELYGVEMPDILITDETIRGLNSDQPPQQLAKPTVLPLMLAKVLWLNRYGSWESKDIDAGDINNRITVVGDDDEKDRKLAENAGVHYIHIDKANPEAGWPALAARLQLGSLATKESR